MQRNLSKIFICIGLGIICIPIVFTVLKIKVKPKDKMEKQISLNFKRNFPLKADLFTIFSFVKTEILDTDPIPKRVIDIKNGWKFLGNNFSNALSESKGLIVFSKKELLTLRKNLTDRKEWLARQNIKYYLAVAPNKHSVYGDMIPIQQYPRNTKAQQLDSLCRIVGVSFIDLGMKFPKDEDIRLYHKTDTHWNDYGGFYAFKASIEYLKKDFPNTRFIDYDINEMNITTTNDPIGDLNKMLQVEKNEAFIHFNFKVKQEAREVEKELGIPSGYHKNPSLYELRFQSDQNDMKVMTLNDSFFGYCRRYFANNFGQSLFIWDYKFDKKLIASEQPDVLFQEILERDIDVLLLQPN